MNDETATQPLAPPSTTACAATTLIPGVDLAFSGVWVPVVDVRREGEVIRACLAFGALWAGARAAVQGRVWCSFRPEMQVTVRPSTRRLAA